MGKAIKLTARLNLPCAFSLVELLVVISIISLLLGIFLPALGRARGVARQTLCQGRLRQWGFVFQIYATENDDFYPHIDGLDRDDDLADQFGWVDMLPPLMGEKPWRDYERWQHPRKNTIFQCPAAELGPSNLYKYKPERDGFFSYAMNSCLELDESCWPPYGQPGGNNMPPFLKTVSIRGPARVILLFDQLLDPRLGFDGKKINRSAGKYCGSYPKAFSARHAKPGGLLGGSILYCDYHVEWKSSVWKPHWPEDLEVPPRDDRDWYPYP